MASCGWVPIPHDEILAWVEQQRESLPTTLAELSAFPVAFRKVIVRTSGRASGKSISGRFSRRRQACRLNSAKLWKKPYRS